MHFLQKYLGMFSAKGLLNILVYIWELVINIQATLFWEVGTRNKYSLEASHSLLTKTKTNRKKHKKELHTEKKGKRKVQGVPQSPTAALPRHQEEEETDKSKQAQTEQTYEKH